MISRMRSKADRLAVRVSFILAIALFPIGVIAFSQTMALIRESRAQSERALLALTSSAAEAEEGFVRTAFGAAEAISSFAPLLSEDSAACHRAMSEFVIADEDVSFAGYITRDGILSCSSGGVELDLSKRSSVQIMNEEQAPQVAVYANGAVSGKPVVVVSYPSFTREGEYSGFASVSIPESRIFQQLEEFSADRPVEIVTFNNRGEVLSASESDQELSQRLPVGYELTDFVGESKHAFTSRTPAGDRRVFAYVPIVPGLVYGLGSWDVEDVGLTWGAIKGTLPLMFPVLMWFACLAIAYLSIQKQVIQPARNLRARMLLFMRSRRIDPMPSESRPATEFREINETWLRMAEGVLRDEAELEDALHNKDILLREVHHRVKNNLQLIASILNMKIRKAKNEDARAALKDVQLRVMGLATVHRNLYETATQGRVQAAELMETIVSTVVATTGAAEDRLDISCEFDPIVLYPDQAVPLSLVVAEALSNALRYGGIGDDGKISICVELRDKKDGRAMVKIRNSRGVNIFGAGPDSTGLGTQLLTAFSAQLDAEVTVVKEKDFYELELVFGVTGFDDEHKSELTRSGAL